MQELQNMESTIPGTRKQEEHHSSETWRAPLQWLENKESTIQGTTKHGEHHSRN